MTNKQYAHGFSAGYKAGYLAGNRAPSEMVIRNDLLFVYGNLTLIMHRRGWSQDDIADLLAEVQRDWVEEAEMEAELAQQHLPVEKIEEKVLRITGIDLVQGLNVDGGTDEST